MKINGSGESEKTNPIQTQSNPIAERVKSMQSVYLQRIMKKNSYNSYKKTKPKQSQFLQKPKMNVNLYVIEDYENESAFRPQKNKPNQTQFPYIDNLPCSIHDKTSALPSICYEKYLAFQIKSLPKIAENRVIVAFMVHKKAEKPLTTELKTQFGKEVKNVLELI